MAAQRRQRELPFDAALPPRQRVDALTARAVRLALWPGTWSVDDAADELLRLAAGSPLLVAAALARLRGARTEDPSDVEARADAALHVAYQRACGQSRSALPGHGASA